MKCKTGGITCRLKPAASAYSPPTPYRFWEYPDTAAYSASLHIHVPDQTFHKFFLLTAPNRYFLTMNDAVSAGNPIHQFHINQIPFTAPVKSILFHQPFQIL